MKRWRLISFDLDGTLVDTAGEIAEAANRALEANGIARRPVAEIALLIGAGTRELMLQLWAQCLARQPSLQQAVRPEALLRSMDESYALTTGSLAKPYAGCSESLAALREAGLRLACVTNKEMRHARRVLEVTALEGFFDLVIGGDSLAHQKPHAGVLQHVAQALAVPLDQVAHVGDSATDIAAARQAGVAAWAVPYGYNAGRPIAEARPDLIFDSLPAVARHVLAAQH